MQNGIDVGTGIEAHHGQIYELERIIAAGAIGKIASEVGRGHEQVAVGGEIDADIEVADEAELAAVELAAVACQTRRERLSLGARFALPSRSLALLSRKVKLAAAGSIENSRVFGVQIVAMGDKWWQVQRRI